MRWTTDKPTQPGWYWVRVGGKPIAIEVTEYHLMHGGRPILRAKEWCGPLETPQ